MVLMAMKYTRVVQYATQAAADNLAEVGWGLP